jgi:hypothetical protein
VIHSIINRIPFFQKAMNCTPVPADMFFYVISYPRSGNTWVVNSLRDYLGAQRGEILPSPYNGDIVRLGKSTLVKVAGHYDRTLPLGVKSHMSRSEFKRKKCPENRMIYLLRDGRDVMISEYFYVIGFKAQDFNKVVDFSNEQFSEFLQNRLTLYVDNVKSWLRTTNALVLRYEALHENYISELKRIKNFLNLRKIMDEKEVKKKNVDNFRSIFKGDNLAFYRKGIVGDWKNYFDDKNLKLYFSIVGDLHQELGYETD